VSDHLINGEPTGSTRQHLRSLKPVAIVSKLLGNSSIGITADIYAHMLNGVGQRAVDGAANLITLTVHSQQAMGG
jgi:hypothetical protein